MYKNRKRKLCIQSLMDIAGYEVNMKEVQIAIPQMGNDIFRKYMKSKYTASLKRSGAATVWIEVEDEQTALSDALKCDGLLLPGGADIEPALYGQEREEKTGEANAKRDRAEPLMIRAFLDAGKPIFGICRGCQMLNVYFGGTLIQDMTDTQKYKHMDFLTRARSAHPVKIQAGTLLEECLGTTYAQVNSMHHQVIGEAAACLTVSAVSGDGFVEAVEYKEAGFCLGVQWHPEHMSRKDPLQQALFDSFVKAAEQSL